MADREDFVYNSQLDAFTIYHAILEEPHKEEISPILPAVGHALAGSLATAATKTLLYPLDLVVTRLQVQKKLRSQGETESAARDANAEYISIADAAHKIYEHEGGLSAFYTGCSSDVTKGLIDSFVFFLAYTFLRQQQLKNSGRRNLPVFNELAVGVVAGSFSKLITTPLQNIVTRQQTAALVAARNPSPDVTPGKSDRLTIRQIASKIYEERGLMGFWAGYGASLILTMNPAITFAADNILRKIFVPRSRGQDPPGQLVFLIAACSKAIATSITYPVQLAKSRAQAAGSGRTNVGSKSEVTGKGSNASRPKQSLLQKLLKPLAAQYAIFVALRDIARQEGIKGLYSGLEGDVLKGFLSHGLTMAVKDRVHGGVIQVYYSLLHLTQQYEAQVKAAQEQAALFAEQAARRAETFGSSAVEAGKSVVQNGEEAIENVNVTEQLGNIGSSLVEAGKNAVSNAQEAVSNTSVVQQAGSVASDIAERAQNISTTVVEAGKSAVNNAQEAISNTTVAQQAETIGSDIAERAENIGTTLVEAGKSVVQKVQESTGTSDIAETAGNVGTTVVEAGKSTVQRAQEVAGSGDITQQAGNVVSATVEAGRNAVQTGTDTISNIDVKEQANLVKDQVVEASEKVVEAGQSAINKIDVRERAENVGTTIIEAGKKAYREGEKVIKNDD